MDNIIYNQKGIGSVGSEKLYSQDEVNVLLENKEGNQEIQTADKLRQLNNRAVDKLVKKSNRILISIRSHALPVDLFPDIVNVEEGRITIINRHLLSSEVHSVDIKNISNIFINRTFLFAQLVIISKTFEENEIKIRNLKTAEAIMVRRIVEGLRVFEAKQIDTSGFSVEQLVAKLKELSTTEIVT